jgi:hypothetical protein
MSYTSVRRFLGLPVIACALAAVLTIAATPGVRAIEDGVPPDVRQGIEDVLKKKAADLLGQKDKNGVSTKRGTYSRNFRKVDASTYLATFHVDTVEPSPDDPKTDRLRTERYELTLKGFAGVPWKIAKEDLKETSATLYRGWSDNTSLYHFDKLAFEREGVTLSATNGLLWMVTRQGKQQGFVLYANDLAYAYTPPPETGYYGLIKSRIVKEHAEDLVFKPERLDIGCDAASCASLFPAILTGLKKIDAADSGGAPPDLAQDFRNAFEKELKDVEKNRKDNPFSGFWLMPEEDRRLWFARVKKEGKKDGKDSFLTLAYDNWEPWEVRLYATGFGAQYYLGPYGPIFGTPLFAYYAQDVRTSKIPPADLERRDDADGRDYELDSVKGSVDVGLDENLELSGDITYGLTVKRDLGYLPFAIARANVASDVQDAKNPRLFVNSIQDGDGNELTWVRRGSYDGLVIFPKPVTVNTKMTLRMRFTSLDSIRKVNPSFSALDRGGWLPFVRFADFIDTFDLTVRTPDRFTVLGIGKKISDEAADGIRTTRWTAEKPVSFPTIIFGDYLSAASDHVVKKSDGTPIPVTVYVDKVSTNALDTRVLDTKGTQGSQGDIQAFREGAASGARDIRGKQLGPIAVQAAVAIELYEKIYGIDYPFAKLDLVADPLGSFYGQAPSSIIYLGFGVFRGEGQVAAGGMFGGGSNIAKFNKDVVAHETAHQWWGSVIANANQRNYWFIETMAEVSSALYVEAVFGKKKYDEKVAIWRDTILKHDQVTSVQNNYTVWAGEDGFLSVQSNIYDKGPYAFHIFRSTFGDAKFYALLKAMAQELQHKEIVTRDIQDVMEKVVGGNMDWFFDQWIRGIGKPQYALNYTTRKNEQGKWIVDGTIKQRVVYGKYKDVMPGVFYRGVAPVTFVNANGKELGPDQLTMVAADGKEQKTNGKIIVQGSETPFRFIVGEEPTQVFFNKGGEILAEDTLINRSW